MFYHQNFLCNFQPHEAYHARWVTLTALDFHKSSYLSLYNNLRLELHWNAFHTGVYAEPFRQSYTQPSRRKATPCSTLYPPALQLNPTAARTDHLIQLNVPCIEAGHSMTHCDHELCSVVACEYPRWSCIGGRFAVCQRLCLSYHYWKHCTIQSFPWHYTAFIHFHQLAMIFYQYDSETVWRMCRQCRGQILTLTTTYSLPRSAPDWRNL